jgi:hypothetical protein
LLNGLLNWNRHYHGTLQGQSSRTGRPLPSGHCGIGVTRLQGPCIRDYRSLVVPVAAHVRTMSI